MANFNHKIVWHSLSVGISPSLNKIMMLLAVRDPMKRPWVGPVPPSPAGKSYSLSWGQTTTDHHLVIQ